MTNLSIRPMFDKVLVEMQDESISKGGIIIPAGEVNEKIQRGVVLAVGKGRRENGHLIPPQVKPGDKVLFDKWSVAELKLNQQTVYLAIEDGIIGIIEDDEVDGLSA